MGNQPSSGFVMGKDTTCNPSTNGQLSCYPSVQPSTPVYGVLNSIDMLPDLLGGRNNNRASKETVSPNTINFKSGEYLQHTNSNKSFYPRFDHEKRVKISDSLKQNNTHQPQGGRSSLSPHQQSIHRGIKLQKKQDLGSNELLDSSAKNEEARKRNDGQTTATVIKVTSRYIYENQIVSSQQQDEFDNQIDANNNHNSVNINNDEESNISEVRLDLSEKLSFDTDSGTLRPSSEASEKDSGSEKTLGWSITDEIPLKNIRNFSIIAHIDHGKSTLADRLLEMTGALLAKPDNKQVLDKLQVEKERGITVKAQTASLFYTYKDEKYLLNLIDTPGHVDFSNEVARSLAACQGVILLVDANQGVQAQTVANFYLAFSKDLTVVPVLNKIDLRNANPDMCRDQLLNLFSIDPDDVLLISAKSGLGVDALVEAIIQRVPPPSGDRSAAMRALIFDSWYDKYRGAVALVYVHDGVMRMGDEIASAHTKQRYSVKGLGLLRPHEEPTDKLVGGQVGVVVCNMRTVAEAHIGDTLHHWRATSVEPLVGFTPARPMVFAGVYPMEQAEYNDMRNAIEKLALNDPAVSLTPESSPVLGQGWRVGFLGLLHLEVFNQRLEQEYGAEAVMTAPSVPYKVKLKSHAAIAEFRNEEVIISDPSKLPDREHISEILEPVVLGTIITPMEYMHKVIPECIERRGVQKASTTIDNNRTMLQFILPLNEIIVDFHDAIKSQTQGFASFDYEDHGYQPADLIKLDIRVNGKVVDSLSSIVHKSKAETMGRRLCEKLVKIIPRQMVEVAIQAAVGSKILARETIKAFRKDVTAKLYGGDRTRKMKLLKKQAEGKKRMKSIANVNIPREAFIDFLKR